MSPAEVLRSITLEMTEQERRDRIRALDIAMILMQDQGYHTRFLKPLREGLARHSMRLNGRTWKPYTG